LDSVFVHTAQWYESQRIELRLGSEVISIDRPGASGRTGRRSRLNYTKLLLAMGSSPRALTVAGADAAHYLRTVDDSTEIRELISDQARLVVIGLGGSVSEVHRVAREAGERVTVLGVR